MTRRRLALLTLALAIAFASPALSDPAPTAPTPEQGAATEEDSGDEVVCKKERPTGSRIPRVVCRTKSQIKDSEAAGKWLINRPKHGTRG